MPEIDSCCPQCGTKQTRTTGGGLCLGCLLSFGLKGTEEGLPAESGIDSEPPGEFIPSDEFERFRILGKLGEGGCGIVYRAEQLQPVRREVALKVIKLGMDTPSVVARFQTERQALALMDHPGIAAVFDAGSTRSGRPFFVMELVPGEPMTRYCERRQLGVEERLRLFVELCQAVQHAHQKGVIHRDIKPSNVLVVETDGVPHPKVIDFGVAKATARQRLADQTIYTAFDQFVGTPAYMSPEQAGLTGDDVDTRTDIYALGVLLYELLTGTPPFDPQRLRAAALDEVCRIIRDEEPARPSTRVTTAVTNRTGTAKDVQLIAARANRLRGDLDWIIMKALEKQRARRYDSASDFARDIVRHLANEPVAARPPGRVYRLGKLIRRNKTAFLAGALVFISLLAGLAISTWRFLKEKEARLAAAHAQEKATAAATRSDQVARLLKQMLEGVGPSVALGRDTTLLREILDRTAERISRELKENPEIEAELRSTVGKAYYEIGESGKAELMHREAIRLREALFGQNDSAVLESLLNLTSVLNLRAGPRDLAEGEALARRAVAIEEPRSSSGSAGLVAALEQLGWNLDIRARRAESQPIYRRILEIRRRLPGIPLTDLVNSLNALGTNLSFDTNKLDEAESLIREGLAMQTNSTREAHPTTAGLLHTLSMILEKRQKMAEAEEAIQESVRMRRKLWGAGNPWLADPLARLAQLLIAEDKIPEAEAALDESVSIVTKNKDARITPGISHVMNQLTDAFIRQKDWAKAEVIAQQNVTLWRANSESRERLLHALHWQAIVWNNEQKWVEAEPVLRESLALCDELRSRDERSLSMEFCSSIRRELGQSLLRQKKFDQAEPFLLTGHDGLRQATDKNSIINLELSLKLLVELYKATARPIQAAEWQHKLDAFYASPTNGPTAAPPSSRTDR